LVLLSAMVVGVCSVAPTVQAQGLGRRFELAELKQIVDEAKVLVRAKAADEPLARGGATDGYAWEVSFEVVEKAKGQIEEQTFVVELKSVLDTLNTRRADVKGKEFVLPLVAAGQGRYRLVGDVGFAWDTDEARKLIELTGGKAEQPATDRPTVETNPAAIGPVAPPAAGPIPLRLRLDPVRAPYEVGSPAIVRVTIENTSADTVTYAQAPFDVRDGRLYIAGEGGLVVTDSGRSVSVPLKDNVLLKTDPPPPVRQVVIPPHGIYQQELDLALFCNLDQATIYLVSVSLVTPDGQRSILSNTAGLKIIASAKPAKAPPPPVKEEDTIVIPPPEVYHAGETINGLAGLLRPSKSQFEVGEPIVLELRLTNLAERAVIIDTRLERLMLLEVHPEGTSPAVPPFSQYFTWPAPKEGELPLVYARLGAQSFWGKNINVNSAFGLSQEKMRENAAAVAKGAIEPSYETSGMTLFAFNSPGVYRIAATYEMPPAAGNGPKLWAGKVKTNPVFIRIVPRADALPVDGAKKPTE
jgi:hypothetical protein